jgi:3-hydroxybutyryl-CoA dehydrogenase
MVIAILANEDSKKEIGSKPLNEGNEIVWADSLSSLLIIEADAYFDLLFDSDRERRSELKRLRHAPVFVNAVSPVPEENLIRINGWPGMLQRELVEIAVPNPSAADQAEKLFSTLGWKYIIVPDIPGFVSARVIAMIINEAYFSFEAGISSREDIDTAMKLGTNYPYGPFEWCRKIGAANVAALLKELYKTDKRYELAPLLLDEASVKV